MSRHHTDPSEDSERMDSDQLLDTIRNATMLMSIEFITKGSVVTGRDMGHGTGRDGTVQDMFPIFYVRDIFGTFFI